MKSINYINNTIERIYGETRYETSYATANMLKKVLGIKKFNNVIVTNGSNFPDALSGGYLSIIKDAPILLTDEKHMNSTVEYIKNNLRINGTVYILGGNSAVSNNIEALLKRYRIKRLYGNTRYETNLKILSETGIENNEILICTGTNYADSLSASAVGKPILLVGEYLTSEQKTILSGTPRKFVIIGGVSAVNKSIENELKSYGTVERLNGANRYETSVLVAKRFFTNPNSVVLTYAWNYPDGLCGGVLAHNMNAPILLTCKCYEKEADSYCSEYNISNGVILGGSSLISDKSANIIFTYAIYTGHNYKEIVTAPTCKSDGYTTYVCNECGNKYKGNIVKSTGHDYTVTTVEATTGWGGYDYHECSKCGHSYKDNETNKLRANEFPKGYKDDSCTIVVYKEWYENAYVYAAHLKFTDYKRFATECANGKYNSGCETTSHAAKRIGSILCVNGDYAIPSNGAGGYCVARNGIVCNDKTVWSEGIYNHNTGILAYRTHDGCAGKQLSKMVAEGKITDTFQFAPAFLLNNEIIGDKNSNSRAQRTFIGTNGNAGDIWICVSDGRSNDGKSAGLNGYQCAAYLQSKGCTFGVALDGGGSSTMYFNGEVLNAAKGRERAVADFAYFK